MFPERISPVSLSELQVPADSPLDIVGWEYVHDPEQKDPGKPNDKGPPSPWFLLETAVSAVEGRRRYMS